MLHQKKWVFKTDPLLLFINIPAFLLCTRKGRKRKQKKPLPSRQARDLLWITNHKKSFFLSVRGWS